jgi:hypothetical protein
MALIWTGRALPSVGLRELGFNLADASGKMDDWKLLHGLLTLIPL